MAVRKLSTTEGRQRLPDLIQEVYGEKTVIVFHRYGRDLAALVPLDMLPRDNTVRLDIPVCSLCAIRFPASFSAECNRPECPHRLQPDAALAQGEDREAVAARSAPPHESNPNLDTSLKG
jgi:hypothetical protein